MKNKFSHNTFIMEIIEKSLSQYRWKLDTTIEFGEFC